MSDPLREQIAANMSTMSTEELLDIWVENDRDAWSDTAFEVVAEELTERGVELPEQDAEDAADEEEQENEEEETPEGEPVFYRPDEVFSLERTIGSLARAAVVITALGGVLSITNLTRTVQSYFVNSPSPFLATFLGAVIAVPLGIVIVALRCALIYFGLKALAAVLRILMEMELNSRGAPADSLPGPTPLVVKD